MDDPHGARSVDGVEPVAGQLFSHLGRTAELSGEDLGRDRPITATVAVPALRGGDVEHHCDDWEAVPPEVEAVSLLATR